MFGGAQCFDKVLLQTDVILGRKKLRWRATYGFLFSCTFLRHYSAAICFLHLNCVVEQFFRFVVFMFFVFSSKNDKL